MLPAFRSPLSFFLLEDPHDNCPQEHKNETNREKL